MSHRWVGLASMLAPALLLAGCGGARTAGQQASRLETLVASIARQQHVEDDVVLSALRQQADDGSRLALAQQWNDALPRRPLPDFDAVLASAAEESRAQLKSAVCSALVDAVRTGDPPTREEFVEGYISGLAISPTGLEDAIAVADAFDELSREADSGDLTSTSVRLKLLEIQYC